MISEENKKFIISNYKSMRACDLSSSTGVERRALFTFLRCQGIRQEDNHNLYDINPKVFEENMTPEAAYILGFIWADGHIQKKQGGIVIDCVKEDMDILERTFDTIGKWGKYESKRQGKREARIFRTYNRPLVDFLLKMDFGSKSMNNQEKIMKIIPDDLKLYFWRGLFDGDGCLHIGKCKNGKLSIAGSYEQDWSTLISFFSVFNISFHIDRRLGEKSKSSTASLFRQNEVVKFMEYIYKNFENDQIGLSRKFNKLKKTKEHFLKRVVSSTGYIGVHKNGSRFYAKICYGSKSSGKVQKYIGFYDSKEEAAKAYDLAAIERDGAKARTNFGNHLAL